ncbi:Rba50p [Kluyveromyces lactis]|uniref:KLLA0C00913p n=1 Tax=Kluyveromyces lactis (strain ATCC 8585 / CBS 2359 / DSM 70799 / NBRC 1267 / NRRL Y-1140 / WM37) TaxID=284590 RepID=Q6CV04_KLULA|nr:uncharacterized protein KLLA0_C00913g [Kluyveromyces lactis]CAH01086.1 KLLA0C00913p [Kluyveromyces lactis]|eukprot:XP_452235.1 uncharacterized protein KLLA0_C00913g [Kluyveromyces lactis]
MDLFGDIVERETVAPDAVSNQGMPTTGFPKLHQPEKVSSWKQRLMEKKKKKQQRSNTGSEPPNANFVEVGNDSCFSDDTKTDPNALSEAERIHLQNLAVLQSMTPEQFERERQELMDSLNPNVLKSLIARVDKKMTSLSLKDGETSRSKPPVPQYAEIEGPGTWIGGSNKVKDLPKLDDKAVDEALGINSVEVQPLKSVRFERDLKKEEVHNIKPDEYDRTDEVPNGTFNDEDDMAPQEYQFVQSIDHMSNKDLLAEVHFIKARKTMGKEQEYEPLDINDPNFDQELHKKFFPDLPQEPDKLKWMQQVENTGKAEEVIHDVSVCRFDFKGNMVPPGRKLTTTNNGLHHHSDAPELAGYTIPELAHLSLSKFPAQRSIAIQTLGRILYKLGKQSYAQLVPEVDAETYQEEGGSKQIINKIYYMFWDVMKDCKVIETLQLAADESKTANISVRNYAIDALWLWKQGGGDLRAVSKE